MVQNRASASSTVWGQLVGSNSNLVSPTDRLGLDALFYDVYTNVAELHLNDLGLDVTWKQLSAAPDVSEDRWGESLQYFSLPFYQLPLGKMRLAQNL